MTARGPASHLVFRALAGVLLTLAGCLFPIRLASAHGGGVPRLSNVQTGPYMVSAWTQGDPLRVGVLHVSVAVTHPENGVPIFAAAVTIRLLPSDGSAPRVAEVLIGTAANKFIHEADLTVPTQGLWTVEIQVDGLAGTGMATFSLKIYPPLPAWFPVFFSTLGLFILVYLVAKILLTTRPHPRPTPLSRVPTPSLPRRDLVPQTPRVLSPPLHKEALVYEEKIPLTSDPPRR